jgi:flagellar biogenesis protein FliO
MVGLTLFGFQLESVLHRPAVETLVLLGFVLLLLILAGAWLTRRFESGVRQRSYSSKSTES